MSPSPESSANGTTRPMRASTQATLAVAEEGLIQVDIEGENASSPEDILQTIASASPPPPYSSIPGAYHEMAPLATTDSTHQEVPVSPRRRDSSEKQHQYGHQNSQARLDMSYSDITRGHMRNPNGSQPAEGGTMSQGNNIGQQLLPSSTNRRMRAYQTWDVRGTVLLHPNRDIAPALLLIIRILLPSIAEPGPSCCLEVNSTPTVEGHAATTLPLKPPSRNPPPVRVASSAGWQ
ncbi:hypothetical protein D9613_003804 [Agrocybe pediades]|uniref:Uncharacterized protein n=1 Tax=Agrocybe pediades TaxID=84607 RepID=A0A8H4QJ31_9AGAR|nr:hypothetical protein D9613_003804 [Agrocybe pediades]